MRGHSAPARYPARVTVLKQVVVAMIVRVSVKSMGYLRAWETGATYHLARFLEALLVVGERDEVVERLDRASRPWGEAHRVLVRTGRARAALGWVYGRQGGGSHSIGDFKGDGGR